MGEGPVKMALLRLMSTQGTALRCLVRALLRFENVVLCELAFGVRCFLCIPGSLQRPALLCALCSPLKKQCLRHKTQAARGLLYFAALWTCC